MPKKPVGEVGPFVVKQTSEGPTSEWAKINWPSDKAGQERFVMDCFVEALRRRGYPISDVIQNKENDFDFRIRMPGPINVDLTEFVYFDGKGNPFERAGEWVNCFDCAKALIALVEAKSRHYGRPGKTPIHVVVYATHWSFRPDQTTIALAQALLRSEQLTMERVFLVLPLGSKRATIHPLYPVPNDLGGKSIEEFKDTRYLPLDPGKFKLEHQP
ncbi:hypothetical protein BDS110ZK18_67030 [Bradyrhizobium diazoefficiens]|uniref:Uncharacterized protein n=1 Tax=Bradyrhizobium diazoefficiens TaxID=1355477 RepID=A0A809XU64_9BRAD|nr:hypothetical protein XF2B_53410 [Bradyrhizobium diazoefficiens]BCF18646.1 hypothetical protein XF13B_53370 [Bradyrhizobium diazoefficiens]